MDLRSYDELRNDEKMVQKLERIEVAVKDLKPYLSEINNTIRKSTNHRATEEIMETLRNIFYLVLAFGVGLLVMLYQIKEHLLG